MARDGAIRLTSRLFVLIVAATRYISLGSVAAAAAFPVMVWLLYREKLASGVIVILFAASLIVIARHHQNIGRLLAGTESRFQLRRG